MKGQTHRGEPLSDALNLPIQLFSILGAYYNHDDRDSNDRSCSSKEVGNVEGKENCA